MRDGIGAAKRGLPTAIVVIDEFARQASFVAEAEGLPDVPVVVLPGPVAGTDSASMAAAAERHVGDVLGALGLGR